MGTECIESHLKGDATEIPLVPPGFVSLTSFTLRRVNEDVMKSNCMDSPGAFDSCQTRMDHELPINDDVKLTRTLRRRPWINYSVFDNSSDEESDSEHLDQDFSSMRHLPKGVIRGCMECSNCQKVTARWQPENACRPKLDEAPVFHPTEEEFEDTLKYIASIRPVAEPYGICRIVPPLSWNPPCPLKEKDMWENAKFSTRIQRVDKLQNRNSMRKMSKYYFHINRKRRRLKQGMEPKNSNGDMAETNPPESLNFNERFGFEPGPQFTLEAFEKYADDFKKQYFCMKDVDMNSTSNQDELRKQQPTIENIEGEYWRLVEKPTEEIEVLYGADIETRVFGSGFPRASTTAMQSALKNRYMKSGWNLNNFSRLPGSVLSFESGDISGVLVPWLYVGMCFSSFCWHVEDHHLYSMNYMHWGAPKVWYGVPGKDALKLEAAMKKKLPDLFEEQPDLLHKLVTQLSPSILKCEGVPVYRCVQHPGEFVLTFPQAYHSGFNCGFNCAEAVNVAPVDWLPHGQNAIELYRDQGRKTTVSHDKLLLGAAGEAVRAQWELQLLSNSTADNLRWKDVCGMNGILTKALKTRVEMERVRREYLCSPSQSRKMDVCFDATSERECIFCFYDLHLSAVGCKCSLDRFACLSHANKLCSCAWSEKFFLFRYEIGELNILVEALGGKLSAIYRWAHQYLGLSLSSHVNKEKLRDHQAPSKPSLGGIKQNEHASVNVVCFSGVANSSTFCQETNGFMPKISSLQQAKEREERVPNAVKSTSSIANAFSIQKLNPSLAMSTFEDGIDIHTQKRKETIDSEGLIVQYRTSNGIVVDQMSQLKEGCLTPDANLLNLPVCQLSQEDISYAEHSETTSSEQNSRGCSLSVPGGKSPTSIFETKEMKTSDVILLSDDEGEDSRVSLMATTAEESVLTHRETSMMLASSDDSATPCNYQMNAVTGMSETNPSAMNGQDVSLIPVTEKGGYISYSAHIKADEPGRDGNHFQCDLMAPNDTLAGSLPEDIWCNVNSVGLPCEQQISNFSSLESSGNFDGVNFGIHPQNNQSHGIVELNIESKDEKPILESGMILKDRAQKPAMGGISNSLDRCYRQKGPRIAKVVRKFNCTVEPLEYGVVFSGRLWSNSQAIFPKGFRSRVKYWSILDPMKMCYYVSEILDAGLPGPLFMVKVESCASEVFIHVSAAKCWDMVRERVNHEIRRQHNLGRVGLPPPQPPGCLDGLEMFGFSTPTIIQAIEAIDHGHICLEYWKSRPKIENTECSLFGNSTRDIGQRIKEEQSHDQEVDNAEVKHPMPPPGADTVLRGLFKKANLEELHSLHKTLSSDRRCSNQVLIRLLDEEIQSRLPSNLPGLT